MSLLASQTEPIAVNASEYDSVTLPVMMVDGNDANLLALEKEGRPLYAKYKPDVARRFDPNFVVFFIVAWLCLVSASIWAKHDVQKVRPCPRSLTHTHTLHTHTHTHTHAHTHSLTPSLTHSFTHSLTPARVLNALSESVSGLRNVCTAKAATMRGRRRMPTTKWCTCNSSMCWCLL